ncbi:hypothetical protein C8R45DRAFT_1127792 [Mycena sanguinolenta]|nr:hypothetical protein C8R45DRAFT_1127792 [Mycena sanguinolenta]
MRRRCHGTPATVSPSALSPPVVLESVHPVDALPVTSLSPRSDPRRITQAHSAIHAMLCLGISFIPTPGVPPSTDDPTPFQHRLGRLSHPLLAVTGSVVVLPCSPSSSPRRRTYLPANPDKGNLPPPPLTRTQYRGAGARNPTTSIHRPGFGTSPRRLLSAH